MPAGGAVGSGAAAAGAGAAAGGVAVPEVASPVACKRAATNFSGPKTSAEAALDHANKANEATPIVLMTFPFKVPQ
jgi:hypothetical protein